MARPDYCRFLPGKWRTSTLSLTWEQEGLLIRISAFNMDAGVPLPPCRTTAARMLGAHRNKLDKVLDALIAAGEVTEDETGIYSARAIEEYRRASGEMKGEKRAEKAVAKPSINPNAPPAIPHSNPTDTSEIPRGNLGVTHEVTAEKSEQILRARRREENREEKKERTPSSVPPAPKAKPPRGARLQPSWALPDDWFEWTRINFAHASAEAVRLEADKFADYWHAKAGQQACKLDWQATWRNWCRVAFAAKPSALPINIGRMNLDEAAAARRRKLIETSRRMAAESISREAAHGRA